MTWMERKSKRKALWILYHRIGWWENLQENPIFDGKNPSIDYRILIEKAVYFRQKCSPWQDSTRRDWWPGASIAIQRQACEQIGGIMMTIYDTVSAWWIWSVGEFSENEFLHGMFSPLDDGWLSFSAILLMLNDVNGCLEYFFPRQWVGGLFGSTQSQGRRTWL